MGRAIVHVQSSASHSLTRIRRLHPHIETKTEKKRHKPYHKYKENKQAQHKRNNKGKVGIKYKDLTKVQQQKLKETSIAHSIRATEGKTPRMRAIRRRRRREYLRIKYKLQNRTKVCTICKDNLAISDFDLQKDKRHGTFYRRTYCYLCRRKMNAEAYQRRKNDSDRL